MSGSVDANPAPTAVAPPMPAEGSKPSPTTVGSAVPGAAPGGGTGVAQGAEGDTASRKGSVPVSTIVAAPPNGVMSNCVYVLPVTKGDVKPVVSTTPLVNFLMQLKDCMPTIPDALRWWFLHKPNVAKAVEQFVSLVRELRAQESLPYTAWCHLAVARCAQSLFHDPAKATALVEAVRLFLRQEWDLWQSLGLRVSFSEHVLVA
ncbi:transcription initiation factor TFIID subunit 10-like [Myiozetetes cayanensis]|uniref:transcription initiation factor TFIID subunit 10-like n=1 Tax=Myiozetetes cayanensis TaxID=478635 RepID=UPI00215E60DA|nr:transcription initiation factor TFIID subunit 10-like [Myiozetetes cayanensis]